VIALRVEEATILVEAEVEAEAEAEVAAEL
jgi:hypothetical protein